MSDLRDYLMSIDSKLGNAANTLWDQSEPIHDRQNRQGNFTENGRAHVLAVELNIYKLLSRTTRKAKANNFDLFDDAFSYFVLSAAACCHDFDKATNLDRKFQHGEGSADFVAKNQKVLHLTRSQRIAIQEAISIHDLKHQDYTRAMEKLTTEKAHPSGVHNLRLIAVILKAADILHLDESRIVQLEIADEDDLPEIEQIKIRSRRSVTGWRIDGSSIIVEAAPETDEEFQAVRRSFEFMKSKEWPCVESVLNYYGFAYNLKLSIAGKFSNIPETTQIAGSIKPTSRKQDYFEDTGGPIHIRRIALLHSLKNILDEAPVAVVEGPMLSGKTTLVETFQYEFAEEYDFLPTIGSHGTQASIDAENIVELCAIWGRQILLQYFFKLGEHYKDLPPEILRFVDTSPSAFIERFRLEKNDYGYRHLECMIKVVNHVMEQLYHSWRKIVEWNEDRTQVLTVHFADLQNYVQKSVFPDLQQDVEGLLNEYDEYGECHLGNTKLIVSTRYFPNTNAGNVIIVGHFTELETRSVLATIKSELSSSEFEAVFELVWKETNGHPWFVKRFAIYFENLLKVSKGAAALRTAESIFANSDQWLYDLSQSGRKKLSGFHKGIAQALQRESVRNAFIKVMSVKRKNSTVLTEFRNDLDLRQLGILNYSDLPERRVVEGYANPLITRYFAKVHETK